MLKETLPEVRLAGRISRRHVAEAGILAGLFLLALSLRLPYVKDVPRWTDEILDMLVALSFSRFEPILSGIGAPQEGARVPLIGYQPYTGALYQYIIAAGWWFFGRDPFLPRLVMAVASALTVIVTYLWGKTVAGRTAGIMAAGMLALSVPAINYGSHNAHSNSLTPLFAALTLWLVHRSVLRRSPHSLIAGGFSFGLALQTHPTAVLLLPAAAGYLALKRPIWLAKSHILLALLLAALAYSNVLMYNLQNPGATLAAGLGQRRDYSGVQQFAPARYLDDAQTALGILIELPYQNVIDAHYRLQDPRVTQYLSQAYLFLILAGLVFMTYRREFLFASVLLSALAVVPLVVGSGLFQGRYWILLAPPLFVPVGGMLAAGLKRIRPWWGVAFAMAAFGVINGYPVIGLMQHFSAYAAEVEPSNAQLAQAAALAASARAPGEVVLVDDELFDWRPPDETNRPIAWIIGYYLHLAGIPEDGMSPLTPARLRSAFDRGPAAIGVMEPWRRRSLEQEFEMTNLAELRSRKDVATLIEVDRVQRRRTLPPSAHTVQVAYGDQVRLLGYDLSPERLRPGDYLRLTLFWEAARPILEDYTVFVHVLDAQGNLAGQLDGQPQHDTRPTTSWQLGEVVADERRIRIAPAATPREAHVEVGLYLRATMQRLPVEGGGGGTSSSSMILPASVTIVP